MRLAFLQKFGPFFRFEVPTYMGNRMIIGQISLEEKLRRPILYPLSYSRSGCDCSARPRGKSRHLRNFHFGGRRPRCNALGGPLNRSNLRVTSTGHRYNPTLIPEPPTF
jgi:hypothetical protein